MKLHRTKQKIEKSLSDLVMISFKFALLFMLLFMLFVILNVDYVSSAPIISSTNTISYDYLSDLYEESTSISSNEELSISLNKLYFFKGELVTIYFNGPLVFNENIYLELSNDEDPNYYYKYLGLVDNKISFYADISGVYNLKLYRSNPDGSNTLLSQKSFDVYSKPSNNLCIGYSLEDSMIIDLSRYNKYKSYSDGFSAYPKIYLSYYSVDYSSNYNSAKETFISQYMYNKDLAPYTNSTSGSSSVSNIDSNSDSIISFSGLNIGKYYLFLDNELVECFAVKDVLSEEELNLQLIYSGKNNLKSYSKNNLPNENYGSMSDFYNSVNIPMPGIIDLIAIQEKLKIKNYYESKQNSEIYSKIGISKNLDDTQLTEFKKSIDERNLAQKPYIGIIGSDGSIKNSYVVVKDLDDTYFEGTMLDINNINLNSNAKLVDIYFTSSTVKKIRFNNVDLGLGIDLSYEDMGNSDLLFTGTYREEYSNHFKTNEDFLDVFAIDPRRVSFDYAEVSFTAVGNALWKCKEYDFSNRNCYGSFVKIMDLIPGKDYSFILTPEDPVFTQTGYLLNPTFENDTASWTTVQESGTPAFAWVSSDSGRSGVAQIQATGNSRNWFGYYNQTFNLSIPSGTQLVNVSFSAWWRINTYTLSLPGNVSFIIRNGTINNCNSVTAFSSTTSWANITLNTSGSNQCFLSNFSANQNFQMVLRCNLKTQGGAGTKDVRCLWDEASITSYYIDVQAPIIRTVNDTPDPVNYGEKINITSNITENIQMDLVLVQINNTNYSMIYSSAQAIYYFDGFNTTITTGRYDYTIFANDTSGNLAINNTGNFTINDTLNPKLNIMDPNSSIFTTIPNTYFYYNVSDESNLKNCSLVVDGIIRSTNNTVIQSTQMAMNYSLTYGTRYWNITCFDNSTNNLSNTSITRNITLDNRSPIVILTTPANNSWISGYSSRIIYFNYTPVDDYISNCSLYGNFTGVFGFNKTSSILPVNNSINSIDLVLNEGTYVWNILCCDLAGTCAFNTTNFTAHVDSTPPYYSNNVTVYPNGTVWTFPRTYQFNITWNELLNTISSVWIEHNFSGTLQNTTVSPAGSVYSFNVADLAAGTYRYRWYANDSLNNINSTLIYNYTIVKAQSNITLLLNGTESDISIGQYSTINLSAELTSPISGYIELYLDSVLITSGNSPLSNMTTFNDQKIYNVTASYPSTQNYSQYTTTRYITVVDSTPPTVGLGNPINNSWNPTEVTFYYTPRDNIDIINCTLIINGTDNNTKNSVINIQNNITINLTDGIYNWTVGCRDTYNNYGFNSTQKIVKIDSILPSTFNLTYPLNDTVSKNSSPILNWTQTIEANFFNYTIQIDNNEGFPSINYIYYTTSISTTNYQIIPSNSLPEGSWYWRVIAYDQALNSRFSNPYIYTVDNTPPVITNLAPSNNYYSKLFTQSFNFTISDDNDILNCSLFINSNLIGTNYSVNKSVTQNFTYIFASDGLYTWSVSCFDEASNVQTTTIRYIIIDTISPSVFDLISPKNNSMYNDATPFLNWTQTSDINFNNYTVQISDSSGFSNINYTYSTNTIVSKNYTTGILSDYIWYWRVIAFDNASNNYTTHYFIYDLDATPPSAFNLITPLNNTFSNNNSPLLNWTGTYDATFLNYTIQISNDEYFSYSNFTYTNYLTSDSYYQVNNWPMDSLWYWRVIAYDTHDNNYTTSTFKYTTDNRSPNISLMYPENNNLWNTSFSVPFIFNVSDVSDISNCTVIINGVPSTVLTPVSKNTNQTITESLLNGNYNWSINCTDAAGFTNSSTIRNITVNVQLPTYRFYETNATGTVAITPPGSINLSNIDDGTENTLTRTIASGVDANMANATITFNGSGFILYAGTLINLSGSFEAGSQNRGYVNWEVYVRNSSGLFTICSTPNGTGGQLITTRNAKETEITTCNSPSYDIRFQNGDSLMIKVNIFNNGASTTFIHYIDNGNPSFIQVSGFKLGILNVTLVNVTDKRPGEGYSFTEQCNVTCSDGYCLDTDVHFRLNNTETSGFADIGLTGRIILNNSQQNPYQLSVINSSIIVNASLFANNYSSNNHFKCVGESQYSVSNSTQKNITVTDITNPSVVLTAPVNGYATDPSLINFYYIPNDPRLYSCSLYLNTTSGWKLNQTNFTPISASTNNFSIYINYGVYLWNVECCDTLGNCGFNNTNNTLYVAGDLSVTSVYFNNDAPAEGETITIFAVLENLANKNESNVLVRFYNGDPDFGGTPIGTDVTVNLTELETKIVNTTWNALIGTTIIYAKVDPLNNLIEANENNNKDYNSTFTAMWQFYYGNVSAVLNFLGSDNSSIINWSNTINLSGNIYITDSDSVISWTTLQALTRDTSGNINSDTTNDFEDIDSCLNIDIHIDNINSTYSLNGLPEQTSTYTIYQNTISNVPDAQSTNNTNFYSGILWDTSDAAQAYYNCSNVPSLREDVVFVTKLNLDNVGKYGQYDYELRVPGELGDYKGANSNIALYYEIQ